MRSANLMTAALLVMFAALAPLHGQPGGIGKEKAGKIGKGKSPAKKTDANDALADNQFRLLDTDANGRLTPEEAPAQLRALWKQYDKNGDGLIEIVEFREFHRTIVQGQNTAKKAGRSPRNSITESEEILRSAGLNTDGETLLEYFKERSQARVDLKETLALARQLGATGANDRATAMTRILGRGPWAVPALHHVVNGLDNPLAIERARHCLEWLEGKRSADLTVAAAMVLSQRKPEAAAEVLLAYLPLADDPSVVDGVKAALVRVASRPGKSDAALVAALRDPLPLRRAIAVEVLATSGKAEVLPELHKILADPAPSVRLRAALVLTGELDETAIGVLIELLAHLPKNERRLAEAALQHLAGEWAPNPPAAGDDELSRKIRHEVWLAWWRAVDGKSLLDAFRRRTLTAKEVDAVQALIEQLDDESLEKREVASAELVALGSRAAGLLRAARGRDVDHAARIEQCLKDVAGSEAGEKLPLSAPRLLAARKPAGAADTLLGFLPFGDDQAMRTEIVKSLTSLVRFQEGADAAIARALTDPLSVRRAAAAEALAGAGGASLPSLRKLLAHADPRVRLPVATALVQAHDREAVPALIGLVAELPPKQAREVEEMLERLASDKLPAMPMGDDEAARKKRVELWLSWWTDHGQKVDLARLDRAPVASELTLVAEISRGAANPGIGKRPKGAAPVLPGAPGTDTDRIIALDRAGKSRWQIDNLNYPMDFQLLQGNRVLIAEYGGKRITERDTSGKILWEVAHLPGAPTNVRRLASGNTFIALYNTTSTGGFVMEVDRAGKTVTSQRVGKGPAQMKDAIASNEGLLIAGQKTADGHMVFLFAASTSCVRVDATGKEVARFSVSGINNAGPTSREGNIDITPKGHLLVMQNLSTLTEFDAKGSVVWQVKVDGHRATRLASGNTLVASETRGVVELDAAGKMVWQYQPPPGYQAVRAR